MPPGGNHPPQSSQNPIQSVVQGGTNPSPGSSEPHHGESQRKFAPLGIPRAGNPQSDIGVAYDDETKMALLRSYISARAS